MISIGLMFYYTTDLKIFKKAVFYVKKQEPVRIGSCGDVILFYLVNCERNSHAFSLVCLRHSWIWLSMLASAVRHTPSSLL